jgi:hypothetical protein
LDELHLIFCEDPADQLSPPLGVITLMVAGGTDVGGVIGAAGEAATSFDLSDSPAEFTAVTV